MGKVAIIMGSKSDLPIMNKGKDFLTDQGIESEVFVASAHRTPDKVHEIMNRVETEFDVVIAGAGLAAHLPGVCASLTSKPIIGVPIAASAIGGMDSLLAIVQMPSGVPVATVAIDGAKNAAILAMQMIALKDASIQEKFKAYKESLKG